MRRIPAIVLGALIASLIITNPCPAIDNPDAPNHVAEFENRAAPYEARITEQGGTTAEVRDALAEYERFLDRELNAAYKSLMKQLEEPLKTSLRHSQRQWIAYRDVEFQFIEETWTRAAFGSSAVLSRGQYRAAIIKARVRQLYAYLMNF